MLELMKTIVKSKKVLRPANPEKVADRAALGTRIREVREGAGLSLREFSARVGVTPSAVSQWELGMTAPDTGNLRTVARILNVQLDWLDGERDGGSVSRRSVSDGELVDVSTLSGPTAASLTAVMKAYKNSEIWRVTSDSVSARYPVGELILVDVNAYPAPQDIVLAMHSQQPIIRMLLPPWLLSLSLGRRLPDIIVDNANTIVRGVVIPLRG